MKEIHLTQGYVALVDDEDFDLVDQFKWRVHHVRAKCLQYAVRADYSLGRRRRRIVAMHRFILGSSPRTNVFHLDGNSLNNCRANLVPGVDFHESYAVNPDTGCWHWLRGLGKDGYGQLVFRGETRGAHRVSFILHNRCEIPPGMVVMHSCDNPVCVNPAHLSLGKHADNIADRDAKGRTSKHAAKLTREQILAVRADTRPHRLIAAEFGISMGSVSNIRAGKCWREIQP